MYSHASPSGSVPIKQHYNLPVEILVLGVNKVCRALSTSGRDSFYISALSSPQPYRLQVPGAWLVGPHVMLSVRLRLRMSEIALTTSIRPHAYQICAASLVILRLTDCKHSSVFSGNNSLRKLGFTNRVKMGD